MDISLERLELLESQAAQISRSAPNAEQLESLRREWLSKDGILKSLFKVMRELPADQRAAAAARINAMRDMLEEFVLRAERELASSARRQAIEAEFIDLSLPAALPGYGGVHPITLIERRIAALLAPFGFVCSYGPEVENEYFCFDALNIPPHHPARDMQDTFYTANGLLLRTHTTSVQSRSLQKGGVPVKVASFGRVYRNETEDTSHQAMFHQFELVWIEPGLRLSHLMGLITHILKQLYGAQRKVKFVPKFYPYTEPSIGPQIDCAICGGKGCGACGGSGWVTVAGAGMVHRKVLEEFKYDPQKVTGFAFGLGTSRLAAQFCSFPNLKSLYQNDLRVLTRVG